MSDPRNGRWPRIREFTRRTQFGRRSTTVRSHRPKLLWPAACHLYCARSIDTSPTAASGRGTAYCHCFLFVNRVTTTRSRSSMPAFAQETRTIPRGLGPPSSFPFATGAAPFARASTVRLPTAPSSRSIPAPANQDKTCPRPGAQPLVAARLVLGLDRRRALVGHDVRAGSRPNAAGPQSIHQAPHRDPVAQAAANLIRSTTSRRRTCGRAAARRIPGDRESASNTPRAPTVPSLKTRWFRTSGPTWRAVRGSVVHPRSAVAGPPSTRARRRACYVGAPKREGCRGSLQS